MQGGEESHGSAGVISSEILNPVYMDYLLAILRADYSVGQNVERKTENYKQNKVKFRKNTPD